MKKVISDHHPGRNFCSVRHWRGQQQLLRCLSQYIRVDAYVSVTLCWICFSGLDNRCTLYPLSLDEDPTTKKRVIATHTSYLSCCKFTNSDQQVSFLTSCKSVVSGGFCLFGTGVDLSKILGEQSKYWGQRVAITDEIIGVSQLLGGTCPDCPQSLCLVLFGFNFWYHRKL